MTRLALGAWKGASRRRADEDCWRRALRATAPKELPTVPRKARRLQRVGKLEVMVWGELVSGDGFGEVEEELAGVGPGCVTGRGQWGTGMISDREQGVGGCGIGLVFGEFAVEGFLEKGEFIFGRRAGGGELEGGFEPGLVVGVIFLKDACGEDAGGFNVLRAVEEDEGLEGGVGGSPADSADFTAGGVEGGHVGRRQGSFPIGVEGAAIEFFSIVAVVGLGGGVG